MALSDLAGSSRAICPRVCSWCSTPRGHPTDFTCTDCSGALHEIDEGNSPIRRYRCRVGHTYSTDALMLTKDQRVEGTLWLALQTLQERAHMLENLASEDRRRRWARNAERYEERARETRAAADRLRGLITALAS